MCKALTFTGGVPEGLARRPDISGKAVRCSRSWLTADALRTSVSKRQWQLGEIEEGLRDAQAGRVVPHEKVERWLKSWGKKQGSR